MDNLKEEVLKESYGYRGNYFWENYIMSNMVRTISSEIKEYNEKDIIEMYSDIYGEEITPIIEYMLSDKKSLQEAAKINGMFLFEEIGEKNINKYLTEAPVMDSGGWAGPTATFRLARGFLKGLWAKVRGFLDKNIFSNVIPFLQKGLDIWKNVPSKLTRSKRCSLRRIFIRDIGLIAPYAVPMMKISMKKRRRYSCDSMH